MIKVVILHVCFEQINHNTFFVFNKVGIILLRYVRSRCIVVRCRKKGFALLSLYYMDIGGTLTFSIGKNS